MARLSRCFRIELEFATEEEDSRAVVLEVAEATRGGFEGLDAAIEAFGGAVADAVAEPRQNVVEPFVNHFSHLDDRLQLAA